MPSRSQCPQLWNEVVGPKPSKGSFLVGREELSWHPWLRVYAGSNGGEAGGGDIQLLPSPAPGNRAFPSTWSAELA